MARVGFSRWLHPNWPSRHAWSAYNGSKPSISTVGISYRSRSVVGGRLWPAGCWHGRSTPSSGNDLAAQHLRFVPRRHVREICNLFPVWVNLVGSLAQSRLAELLIFAR